MENFRKKGRGVEKKSLSLSKRLYQSVLDQETYKQGKFISRSSGIWGTQDWSAGGVREDAPPRPT